MTRPSRVAPLLCVALASIVVCGCKTAALDQRLIDQIATALGGKERILDVTSLRIEGQGETFSLGQNRTIDGPLPRYTIANVVRRFDFARNRSRIEQVRTPTFPTGNTAPVRQFVALDGDVAFTVSESGVIERQDTWTARERRAELRHTPISIVRTALATGVTRSAPRVEDAFDVIDITDTDGIVYTLFADRSSHLPRKVRVTTTHPNLGDTILETEFDAYAAINGVQVPGAYTTRMDAAVTARLTVTGTTLNAGVEDLVAPPPVASSDANPPRPIVVVDEIGPGLWHLTGQSHHSVLAEFSDHLTVIEAPLSEARTLAVIQRARELRPAKPVTQVITSHHHFDHIAGVRAAVAEGLTLVVPASTRPFYEALVTRPRLVSPDALAKAPKPPQFLTYDRELVIEDATMSLHVLPIEGSAHADPFAMVYFPKQRALYEVDAFTPGAVDAKTAPPSPFAKDLRDAIVKRGLKVERILAGHGRAASLRELEAAASAAPSTP